jgi:hypothetical protein
VVDLRNGFHQLRLPDDVAEWLAFSAGGRRWAWTVLPFGLAQSPTLFQSYMRTLFDDLICAGLCDVYVDDLVVFSDDPFTHAATCKKIRDRLLQAGVKLNATKIQHAVREVRLLGHVVSHDSIRPCPEYCDALCDRVMPRTDVQRRAFRGAVGWIAKFVPACATLLSDFDTSPSQETFDRVMQAVRDHVNLSPMVPDEPLDLYADASLEGWGGVLMQNGRVLGCASGRWRQGERNWQVREQELQGVLRSLRHFRYYAAGSVVNVYTDHSSNTNVRMHRKVNQSKLLNWLAELGSWNLIWSHIPGKENVFADWLSRNPSDMQSVKFFELHGNGVGTGLGGGS